MPASKEQTNVCIRTAKEARESAVEQLPSGLFRHRDMLHLPTCNSSTMFDVRRCKLKAAAYLPAVLTRRRCCCVGEFLRVCRPAVSFRVLESVRSYRDLQQKLSCSRCSLQLDNRLPPTSACLCPLLKPVDGPKIAAKRCGNHTACEYAIVHLRFTTA